MRSVLAVREFDNFSRILSEAGFSVINCPTIKTVTLEDLSEFERQISAIEIYDGVFLTSAKAAKIFIEKLRAGKNAFSGKVYVLGKRSFDLLQDERLDLFFDEATNTASEMLDKIPSRDLKGARFLFVRGEKSLGVVPDFLKSTASLDEAVVYRTEKIAIDVDKKIELREKFANGEIVCACFFSPSAAENFIEQFGTAILHQTIIAAIGRTTARFFERRHLTVGFVSPKAKAEDYAAGLINYLNG